MRKGSQKIINSTVANKDHVDAAWRKVKENITSIATEAVGIRRNNNNGRNHEATEK